MIKFIYFFLLIVISHTLANSQDIEIFLIKDKIQIFDSQPEVLKIGVISSHSAYYKLVLNKDVLKGSQFQKGMNIIEIESVALFNNPGSFVFQLITKKNQIIKTKNITIRFQFLDKIEASERPKNNSENMEILIPGNKNKLPQNTGPLNPFTHRYENLDSINLFGIISTLIKNKKQKSLQTKLKRIKSRLGRCKKMTIGYYPDNTNRNQEPIYVLITLKWENAENKP